MSQPVTRHLTILLTDIKGFTDKTSRRSRSDIQALLDKHRELVLPTLEGRGGRLIKTIGDAFLMVFESPTDAVLAGIAVQEVLSKHNAEIPEDDRIEVRIAINAGEVNLAENDVFGEPVNITARIESIAKAGEVFFTEAVYLAMNKTEVPSSEVGLLQLKGIPEKVRVYKVRKESPVGSGESLPRPAGFFSALRGAPAGPEPKAYPVPSGASGRPPLWRRGVAVLIDLVLVGMLVGILTGGESERVHVGYKAPKDDPLAQLAEGRTVIGEDGTKVQLGKDGLHVEGDDGTKVTLGKGGIRVDAKNAKVALDKTGVQVDAHRSKRADEDDEDSTTLYDEDGVSVRTERRRKNVAFPLFWLLYSTLFLGLWKATPGKRVLKLEVARMDGAAFDWKDAFVRSLFSLISGYAVMFGYLWALWERDRRGWHDLWAGTVVRGRESA
ncbi:MAG: RDD family protein [Elusimicrobiota bacterium]|jgi:class 3 adenylate cyclase